MSESIWKRVWRIWAVANIGCWSGFELGKPRRRKDFVGDSYALAEGVTKGVLSAVIPPACGYFLYKEMQDWRTCQNYWDEVDSCTNKV